MVQVVGVVVVGLGLVMIVAGSAMSIADWRQARQFQAQPGEFHTEPAGAAEVLTGLERLFIAIGNYPIGRFLVAIGFSLIVIGSIIATAGALTA